MVGKKHVLIESSKLWLDFFCLLFFFYFNFKPLHQKKLYAFFILSFYSLNFIAQDWVDMMEQPGSNFYTIQAAFNNYFTTHDPTEKGKGWKQFKRWENCMEPRVYPSGDLTLPSQNMKNFEIFLQNNSTQKLGNPNMIASSTWTAVGPFGAISGSAGGQLLKSGRLNFITIHPAGSNTLFVAAPAGGLWKSTNGGTSWTTNTDFLKVTGCSDLAIDPSNPDIMYLATGDGDAGDTYSTGILKSTDGGNTWVARSIWSLRRNTGSGLAARVAAGKKSKGATTTVSPPAGNGQHEAMAAAVLDIEFESAIVGSF